MTKERQACQDAYMVTSLSTIHQNKIYWPQNRFSPQGKSKSSKNRSLAGEMAFLLSSRRQDPLGQISNTVEQKAT